MRWSFRLAYKLSSGLEKGPATSLFVVNSVVEVLCCCSGASRPSKNIIFANCQLKISGQSSVGSAMNLASKISTFVNHPVEISSQQIESSIRRHEGRFAFVFSFDELQRGPLLPSSGIRQCVRVQLMPAPKKRCKKNTGISWNFGRPYIDRIAVTSAEKQCKMLLCVPSYSNCKKITG